ncbi:MAG: ABC transporter substrate-binding protein [Thermodesulfobacteriota bacterium]
MIRLFMVVTLWLLLSFPGSWAYAGSPDRIVSLGPVITDMIYLLGAGGRLVAVTSYCKTSEDDEKEIIGTVMQMNVEKIVHLEPDLVIANALTRQKQIRLLQKQGVQVIELETPENFEQICSNFVKLGTLVGKEEKAKTVTAKARERVSIIRKKADALQKRTVFIQIGIKPLKTSPEHTFINEYIEFAGGINIAKDAAEGVYSREKVLKKNPDVILIATMGSSKKAGLREKEAWSKFSFLEAVKNKNIHVLDPDIVCSPTPEVFARGLADFFRLIHPDKKEEVRLE